jgi:hypothetical protein
MRFSPHVLALVSFLAVGCSDEQQPSIPESPASGVVERDGNIYYIDDSGKEITITSLGIDFQPSLSTDEKFVTFARDNPAVMIETPIGTMFPAREIWKASVDASDAPSLVVRHTDLNNDGRPDYGSLSSPTFSNDNSEIYFLTECWVTSHALYSVKLSDISTRFVTNSNYLEIIRNGRFVNDIIVQRHSYFVGSGSYDWYWIVSSDGKTRGTIGESTDHFRENFL